MKLAQDEENRDVARGKDAEEVGDGRNDVKRVSSWESGNLAAKCSLSLSVSVDMRNEAEPRRWGCAFPANPNCLGTCTCISLSVRVSLSLLFGGGTNYLSQLWPFGMQGQYGTVGGKKGRPQSRDGSVAVANICAATAAGLHDKLQQKS